MLEELCACEEHDYPLLSVFFMGMDKTRKCGVDGAEWVQGGGVGCRIVARVLGLKCPQGHVKYAFGNHVGWWSFQSSVHVWISEFSYKVLSGQEFTWYFAETRVLVKSIGLAAGLRIY